MISGVSSLARHPVAVPVGLGLLAVSLLGGVVFVAVHEGNDTVQRAAQTRVRSNRDAAVRALVDQTVDFKHAVAAWSVNTAVIDALRIPRPIGLDLVRDHLQDHLMTWAHSQDSAAAFVSDTGGADGCGLPVPTWADREGLFVP